MSKQYKLVSASVVVIAIIYAFSLFGLTQAATSVNLGTASNFAILAGSTVTNTGSSVINGDLGLSPGTSVTGFLPGIVNGTQHVANTTADNAKTDLITAYNDAAGQTPVTTVPTELGGTTKTAGIYDSADGTFGITGTLTLDAQGDPSSVFIFKTASTLITAGSSVVSLANGAQSCNVFWQVGSSATLGTNSTFKGNILALTSATLTTGAGVDGRVLARNAAVTLDTNTITVATCAVPTISVAKTATPSTLTGSGSVTYDYTVTNTGAVAMSSISVTDDKCSSVSFVSGDTDSDSRLDTSESWKYNCVTTLTETTTNTVTATGTANSLTASATATSIVTVTAAASTTDSTSTGSSSSSSGSSTSSGTTTSSSSTASSGTSTSSGSTTSSGSSSTSPGFPNAGVEKGNVLRKIVVTVALLTILSALYYLSRKKHLLPFLTRGKKTE